MTSRFMALRTIHWQRLLRPGRVAVSGILLVALAVGGVLAMRMLRPAAPTQLVPGQQLAWDIARTASHSDGVQLASGAYLAGDTMLLYSRTTQTDRARVRTWALLQIEPFAERLAKMPAKETLKWVIDFGPAPAEQEVITAPLSKAADPTLYTYTSAAPGLFGDAGASPPATSAAPTAAPAVASAPTAAPTAAPAAATAPATIVTTGTLAAAPGTALVNSSFEGTGAGALKGWHSLAGDWAAKDGVYSQRDKTGYDFISMLDLAPQSNYSMEARIRLGDGDMGGGFIYNAPSQTSRAGAQVVDMDNHGGFLRWGRYDAQGAYVYEGGVKVDPALNDGQWHTLNLLTHADTSALTLDGHTLGTITNTSPAGYLGLIASKAQVDFDSVTVTLQPQSGAVLVAPTAAPAASNPITSTAAFSDTFADGNADGWRVLNGAWQVINQEYQQTSSTGFDLGSISAFQGEAYTVSVQLRRIDGDMGAGLYFNMSQRDAKTRSQMINYTQAGKVIQWGHFDDGGNFVFEGSAPVPDGSDGKWHTLAATVRGGKASFTLDDKPIAQDVKLTYARGYVGLLTSASKVAFDDVQIAPQ